MNPSKENARKALEAMESHWWDSAPMGVEDGHSEARDFIKEFLAAAERRLPSEAAIAREKARRKTKPKRPKAVTVSKSEIDGIHLEISSEEKGDGSEGHGGASL